MEETTVPRRWIQIATYACAVTTVMIGVGVLCGWLLDLRILKSLLAGYITMKANTAISFVLLGAALVLGVDKSDRKRYAIFCLCITVAVINLATLVEYLAHINLGIDELLFLDSDGVQQRFPPGRLAPITAINFLAMSFALLGETPRKKSYVLGFQIFAVMVVFASFQALIGYLIGVNYIYGSAFYTQMAIHTALAFILIAAGTLLLNPSVGLMIGFTAKTPIARLSRWMFFSVALIPPVIRSIAQLGLEHGLYDPDFAQLFQVGGITILLAIVVGVVGNAMFRTERSLLQKQNEFNESQARFEVLANSMPQLAWMTDGEGSINWYNQRWFEYTGSNLFEMKGWGWQKVHHPDHVLRVTEKFKKHVADGTPWEDTFPIRSASGEWRWFLSRAHPIKDVEGKVHAWFGTNTDITQNLKNEEALNESREVAENASRAKTQFLANMSHEIRTPVGAIIGFTELIKNPSTPAEEKADYVEIVDRNSRNLLRLIDDILDLSKVEAGKIALEFAPFSLTDLIAEMASVMQMKAAEKGIRFDAGFEGLVPEQIATDSLRLRQILINLVGNAIKFTDQGFVKLTVSYSEPVLILRVHDSGIGILKEQLPNLFQTFGQADPSMTRKFGGTGLGLILSKRLSQALGGDLVLVSSEPGIGSTFVASIETQLVKGTKFSSEHGISARSTKLQLQENSSLRLQGLRVLLVEDSPDNQILIQTYLKKSGAHVDLAENGAVGVQKALATFPDIILMDIQMAVMDGHEATRTLRAKGFFKPIVALTAHAMREERDRCFASGCTDYLTKPIDRENLIEVLSRFEHRA